MNARVILIRYFFNRKEVVEQYRVYSETSGRYQPNFVGSHKTYLIKVSENNDLRLSW